MSKLEAMSSGKKKDQTTSKKVSSSKRYAKHNESNPKITSFNDVSSSIPRTKNHSLARSTPMSRKRSSTSRIPIEKNSSLQKTFNDSSAVQYLAQMPTLESFSEEYKPMPYTFRIPLSPANKEIRNSLAKCPPFYLQLDHALAVIWCLFSKKQIEKPLGIAQLQWALNFLKGIYNRKGEHPKDVGLCIQAIQDKLIEQYADMIDEISRLDKAKEASCSSCCTTNKCYKNTSERSFQMSSDSTLKNQTTKNKESELMITKRVPFSVNYSEMMKSTPACIEQLFTAKADPSLTEEQIRREIDDIKQASMAFSGTIVGTDANCSRENIVSFLKAWRKEQVDKIQTELKRLHSIEMFIENVDKDNFEPYLDENQMDVLIAKKVRSNTNDDDVDGVNVSKTTSTTLPKGKKKCNAKK